VGVFEQLPAQEGGALFLSLSVLLVKTVSQLLELLPDLLQVDGLQLGGLREVRVPDGGHRLDLLDDADPQHFEQLAEDGQTGQLVGEHWSLEVPLAADAGHLYQLPAHVLYLVASKQDLVYLELAVSAQCAHLLAESAAALNAVQALIQALGVVSKQQVDGALVHIKV
jgi:hypothetical protein